MDIVGTYSWGLIPQPFREPLWWILCAWLVILLWFFFKNLHKVAPENLRGYNPWGPHHATAIGFNINTKRLSIKYPEEAASENALILGKVILVALVIFAIMMIKTGGRLAFETPPVVNTTVSEIKVHYGQIATIAYGPGYTQIVHTCQKTVNGPQFTVKGRYSDYSKGDVVYQTASSTLTSEIYEWWGVKKTYSEHKLKYVCTS